MRWSGGGLGGLRGRGCSNNCATMLCRTDYSLRVTDAAFQGPIRVLKCEASRGLEVVYMSPMVHIRCSQQSLQLYSHH